MYEYSWNLRFPSFLKKFSKTKARKGHFSAIHKYKCFKNSKNVKVED